MNKLVVVLAVVFTSVLGFAQSDAKSKKLLDEVSNKMSSYKNMYVEFKYVLDNEKQKVHQETRGNVTLSGDKYNLNFLGSQRMFDGKKVYTVVPENEEVNISDVDVEDEGSLTPSKFFSFYKKGYTYTWDKLKNINGRKIQYVKLRPIDSNSPIAYVLLGIDVNTKHIYNLIETGENKTLTTLTVTKFKPNQALSNNLFVFDEAKFKTKGYLINRL